MLSLQILIHIKKNSIQFKFKFIMNVFSFSPPKQETFFKDDANHDPQWTEDEVISANFEFNGRKIGKMKKNQ